jgi:AMMECR1 domain-containing protein
MLRGCIGTIIPTKENVAKEIIDNAISACSRDYRFDKVNAYELDYLIINVDVLKEPVKIESIDELDVYKYGIIVSTNNKRGVLLPDIEGVDTISEQIRIAMKKGNISNDEEYIIEKFEVERHELK